MSKEFHKSGTSLVDGDVRLRTHDEPAVGLLGVAGDERKAGKLLRKSEIRLQHSSARI
jgi:hypothetical protein